MAFGSFKVNDRSETTTTFLEDTWVSNHSFKDLYPTLYNIINCPHDIVANIMRSTPPNISFRTALVGGKLHDWEDSVAKIAHIDLADKRDLFIWNLHNNG